MKNKTVEVPAIKNPIQKSPGFAKKDLADFKLDIMALCGFGCRYCSSNSGNYLRINRTPFTEAAMVQLGEAEYLAAKKAYEERHPSAMERQNE
jgi:hypothetical protein